MTTSYSEYSFHKQNIVRSVVEHISSRHTELVSEGLRFDEFVFVDAHGGLGMWRNNAGKRCLGSPVVIYKTLEQQGVSYRGFVFEKNEARCERLEAHTSFSMWPVECYNMDNCNAPNLLANHYGHASYISRHDGNVELGGLIYYDCDGVGSASEVEQLTRDNRLDVLLHFSTGKRAIYRQARNPDDDSFTLNADSNVIGHLSEYHRPYWYIGDPWAGYDNKFNFTFLFGTHSPVMLPGNIYPMRSFQHINELEPVYTLEGIHRQHKAFYSREDMLE